MKPIGGYFSLELNDSGERHPRALRLNAGRYALEYILKVRGYRKVYIPYYICDSVLQPINRLGVEYEFYHINEQLEPAEELHPAKDEAVLYVNYFGLKPRYANTFCYAYPNTILDNTQAFYCDEGNYYEDPKVQCDTIYSCRKFFGVPDGAYLYLSPSDSRELNTSTPQDLYKTLSWDESFVRMTFLTKRIDRSPQEAYADFRASTKDLSEAGLKRMSRLTEAMMRGIDFTRKANRRIHNFHLLDDVLRPMNQFKGDMDYGTVPLIYPFLVENGAQLRQHLIDNQIFCARYWPDVLERCNPTDFEYHLAENLVCIPVDQRYGEEEMNKIIEIIQSL